MFGFCGICGRISGVRQCTKSCPTLVTPWTVACQAPLSTGFSRQEYWSGLPFPSPRIVFLSRKAYSLIFRNCPHLRTVWVTTMGPWGYHQIILFAQLLKEIAFKKHKEAVTKGVKDNYIQEDSVSSLFLLTLCNLLHTRNPGSKSQYCFLKTKEF